MEKLKTNLYRKKEAVFKKTYKNASNNKVFK